MSSGNKRKRKTHHVAWNKSCDIVQTSKKVIIQMFSIWVFECGCVLCHKPSFYLTTQQALFGLRVTEVVVISCEGWHTRLARFGLCRVRTTRPQQSAAVREDDIFTHPPFIILQLHSQVVWLYMGIIVERTTKSWTKGALMLKKVLWWKSSIQRSLENKSKVSDIKWTPDIKHHFCFNSTIKVH